MITASSHITTNPIKVDSGSEMLIRRFVNLLLNFGRVDDEAVRKLTGVSKAVFDASDSNSVCCSVRTSFCESSDFPAMHVPPNSDTGFI